MKGLIQQCLQEGHKVMPELEAQKLCAGHSIPCPPTQVAQDKDECVAIAQSIGYPVVMKVLSRQIVHKSDAGGVIVNIRNDEEMAAAFTKMNDAIKKNCPDAKIDGFVIQKMMPSGIEVVVGALRNSQFGPVVMFGMGGIYIEVFKDVEFRLAPLSKEEALRQIEETKIATVLKGVRGQAPCDIDALAELIVNVGKLICDFEEIKEIDFNPVLSYPDGCVAVDARIVIGD
ncbi:succinyl-CoA synthetase subunit beta [Pseudodesulfovibrio hydrargyri]|uniref:Succinyl-CoA synthetase subunit beta n=1 Tax=Pseudodesulfovibrio hydrargyri TaxID=2125990 RepID=A0A1J5MX51_9BACT|nr:acetate--CoA ligase family protein [Pseudodesulfovibrio hydrargyri]OIQ50530.1 succinyl-CoA synthetase subunit beta [Pseudodesulfovibrio hydrargyri]